MVSADRGAAEQPLAKGDPPERSGRPPVEPPHDTLYTVIGTIYGGDEGGFNLPDLRPKSSAEVTFIIAVDGVPPRR